MLIKLEGAASTEPSSLKSAISAPPKVVRWPGPPRVISPTAPIESPPPSERMPPFSERLAAVRTTCPAVVEATESWAESRVKTPPALNRTAPPVTRLDQAICWAAGKNDPSESIRWIENEAVVPTVRSLLARKATSPVVLATARVKPSISKVRSSPASGN